MPIRRVTNEGRAVSRVRAKHPTAAPTPADLDEYVPPDPMLEIDRDTMALLGELADRRRENESAVVAAAVAAFHAATCGDPESLTDPRGIAGRT